jgi:hypothetical protein
MMQLFTEEGWSIVTNKKRVGLLVLVGAMVPILLHLFHKHMVYRTPKMLIYSPSNQPIAQLEFSRSLERLRTQTLASADRRALPPRLCLLSAKATRRNSDSVVPDLFCDHRNNKLRG